MAEVLLTYMAFSKLNNTCQASQTLNVFHLYTNKVYSAALVKYIIQFWALGDHVVRKKTRQNIFN